MKMDQKKEKELAQLEKALTLLNESYEVIDKNGEAPDFLIKLNGHLIGVEVTGVYRGSSFYNSKKTESDLPIIAKESLKLYDKKGGAPLDICFCFDGRFLAGKRDIVCRELADFLYEHIQQLTQKPCGIIKIIPDTGKYPSLMLIKSIFAKPTKSKYSVGVSSSVYDSIAVDDRVIQDAIRKKAGRLSEYRQHCDAIWLLIVLPIMRLAADYYLPNMQCTDSYAGFDSILILDDYRHKIVRYSALGGGIN